MLYCLYCLDIVGGKQFAEFENVENGLGDGQGA